MIQSLHIFRKDVRHLWPELSIYVALLIAFVWTAPLTWAGSSSTQPQVLLQLVLVFLHALLPILWLVMIARLIHDESLVGDQQFWITRPYKWPSLLGAKLLFIVAGIILPFVAMQWFLLLHAGLHPLSAIPGLLLNLLYLTLLCWLPFTVIAAVTSTLPRAAMSMVASVIALIVILVIGSRTAGLRMDPPYLMEILGTIFAVLLVAILLYQYMGRRTTWSRMALIVTPVLLIALFAAYPTDLLVRRIYPASSDPASSDPAARLTFDSDPGRYESQQGRVVTFGSQTIVNLPAELQGVDPSVRFGDGGLSFTIDAPGYHYVSPWLLASPGARTISILFPQEVITRFHGKDVHLHLTLVSKRLFAGAAQAVTANTEARFNVPNKGVCSYPADQPGTRPFCNYPYQSPPTTRVTGLVSVQPCEASGPTHPGIGNIRNTAQVPSFDPVVQELLNLSGNICNGAQLTFTPYLPSGKLRVELDIPAITFDHYVAHIDLARRAAQGMPPTAPPAPQPATAK